MNRYDFSAGDGWRVAGGGWRVTGDIRRVTGEIDFNKFVRQTKIKIKSGNHWQKRKSRRHRGQSLAVCYKHGWITWLLLDLRFVVIISQHNKHRTIFCAGKLHFFWIVWFRKYPYALPLPLPTEGRNCKGRRSKRRWLPRSCLQRFFSGGLSKIATNTLLRTPPLPSIIIIHLPRCFIYSKCSLFLVVIYLSHPLLQKLIPN